jgi:hypothetical protein
MDVLKRTKQYIYIYIIIQNRNNKVWTTSRLLSYLDQQGIAWEPIELQIRNIMLTTLTSAYDKMFKDVSNVPLDLARSMFSHWRFDFLFDAR